MGHHPVARHRGSGTEIGPADDRRRMTRTTRTGERRRIHVRRQRGWCLMIAAHQHGVADRNMRMCPPNTSVRILTGRNFDNVKSEFLPVPKDARGGAERPVHFFAVDTFYWVSCFANSKVHASIQLLSARVTSRHHRNLSSLRAGRTEPINRRRRRCYPTCDRARQGPGGEVWPRSP